MKCWLHRKHWTLIKQLCFFSFWLSIVLSSLQILEPAVADNKYNMSIVYSFKYNIQRSDVWKANRACCWIFLLAFFFFPLCWVSPLGSPEAWRTRSSVTLCPCINKHNKKTKKSDSNQIHLSPAGEFFSVVHSGCSSSNSFTLELIKIPLISSACNTYEILSPCEFLSFSFSMFRPLFFLGCRSTVKFQSCDESVSTASPLERAASSGKYLQSHTDGSNTSKLEQTALKDQTDSVGIKSARVCRGERS